jgi:hypothetical protein
MTQVFETSGHMLNESVLRLTRPFAIRPNANVWVSITVQTDESSKGNDVRDIQGEWERLSPEEKAADLKRWFESISGGPGLPDEAVGRDAIYD